MKRPAWRTRWVNRKGRGCGSICPPFGRSLRTDRRLKLEFHGSKVTSDAGLLAYREPDDALGLTEGAGGLFRDTRTGKNESHGMTGQFRQSIFGRLGGYVEKQAASTSQMGRFETELLSMEKNLSVLSDISGIWIDKVHARFMQGS